MLAAMTLAHHCFELNAKVNNDNANMFSKYVYHVHHLSWVCENSLLFIILCIAHSWLSMIIHFHRQWWLFNDEENPHDPTLLFFCHRFDWETPRRNHITVPLRFEGWCALFGVIHIVNSWTSLPHLFEHKDTVSRANELRQLCNASLVKVRPRETAMVEVDLGTAVLPVPLSCMWTYKHGISRWNISHCGILSWDLKHSPVSDWLAICCLTVSGEDDLGGVRL